MPESELHAVFLAHLPRFRTYAALALRRVRCPDAREDLQCEVVALAWKVFARLEARGRSPERFVAVLALRCTQAIRAGRRLAGSESARDVMSPVARVRHAFSVSHLGGSDVPAEFAASTRGRVPDRAAFRIDFPRWRARFGRRDRAVLDALAAGGRTGEVAAALGRSPARVSQLRRVFLASWHAFHAGR